MDRARGNWAVVDGVAAKLRAIVAELGEEFVEREVTLTNAVLALLARQHHMVIGPVGAAKSAAHEAVVARITGARFFAAQMHDAMKADELFGQIDMAVYDREGRWVRDTSGYLPEAHLAMIDEIDKGQHLLRSLLRVANERRWRNGDVEVDLPLITMVASANAALGEDLLPVWDRFLVRESVSYIAEPENFMAMLAGAGRAVEPTTIELAELQAASTLAVPAVSVGREVLQALWALREDLRARGVVASDRRWKDCVRLLQARAFLSGRSAVVVGDLRVLRHVLWSSVEQVDVVGAALMGVVGGQSKKLGALVEALRESADQLQALEGQARTRRVQAASDLAERLSRVRAELAPMALAQQEQEADPEVARAVRMWVNVKAQMNVVCAGMGAERALKGAERAWGAA